MIPLDDLTHLLEAALPEHLQRQRWSGAQDRSITRVGLQWLEVVRSDEPMLVWTVARARFGNGDEQDYQLFLGVRLADPLPEFLQGKERELVALLPERSGVFAVYDALVDPDLAVEVLHLAAPGTEVEVRRPIVLEHSNSSVVFDERHILKVFRKVAAGPNPDVEITRQLAARGFEHVLAPTAALQREGMDLAVLRDFLVGATEGWELARASVRDLLAGGLPPEECGADFAPDAERLGAILASLHLAMADVWGVRPGAPRRWATEMEANLDDVLAGDGALHPASFDHAAIADRFHELAGLKDPGPEIRIHGDLHLAQVIKADTGWKILDFEGEPARRRDDRFTASSPLRDVAGMLRSFHYVAAIGLSDWDSDVVALEPLVAQWEERNRAAFLLGYLATEGVGALLPESDDARRVVLEAFELDKAVYEVAYELRHRPDLLRIPLTGVTRLLAGRTTA